jgi:hypothetical protein
MSTLNALKSCSCCQDDVWWTAHRDDAMYRWEGNALSASTGQNVWRMVHAHNSKTPEGWTVYLHNHMTSWHHFIVSSKYHHGALYYGSIVKSNMNSHGERAAEPKFNFVWRAWSCGLGSISVNIDHSFIKFSQTMVPIDSNESWWFHHDSSCGCWDWAIECVFWISMTMHHGLNFSM